MCLKYKIDGVVVQTLKGTREEQIEIIQQIRKFDVNGKLDIVAAGCQSQGVQTSAEASDLFEAGANSVSVYSKLFTEGPYAIKNLHD